VRDKASNRALPRRRLTIIKHFVLQFSPVFSFLPSSSAKLPSSTPPFSNTLSLRSSLNMSDQVSHPYKTTSKMIFLCILIFTFSYSRIYDQELVCYFKIHTEDRNPHRRTKITYCRHRVVFGTKNIALEVGGS